MVKFLPLIGFVFQIRPPLYFFKNKVFNVFATDTLILTVLKKSNIFVGHIWVGRLEVPKRNKVFISKVVSKLDFV